MKKVLFTAMAAVAMFALVSCNNKKAEEPAVVEEVTVEQCEHKCMHEGDSAMCCKAEALAAECEHQCEKACEHKCAKAEGQECCKKAEGKECCKKAEGQKCCKGEGKECEKKCEKAQ